MVLLAAYIHIPSHYQTLSVNRQYTSKTTLVDFHHPHSDIDVDFIISDLCAVGWFVGWFKLVTVGWLGSTRALRPVAREEGRADPVGEVRLVENIHWGVTRGPAKFCLLLMRCFNKDSVESD